MLICHIEDMLIREYTPADRQACLQIFNSNVPTFFASHELKEFEEWLNGQAALELASANLQTEYYYVLEEKERIIACGGFYLPENDAYATMVWGMVENSFHKKGIGRKFLEYRIRQIRLLKPAALLSLDTTQHSYKFFEKFEFKVTKVTKDYYATGLDRYDMIG